MATPLLLSDADLEDVKTTFATYFTDPEPFRKQIEITRRVSAAVSAIGGATSTNAPGNSWYINLVVALDDMSNGDYPLADFMAKKASKNITLSEVATHYHELLDQKFSRTTQVQMKLFDKCPTEVLYSLINNDKITTSLDATTKKNVINGLQTAISRHFVIGKYPTEALIADPAYSASVGSSDTTKAFMRKLGRLAVLVQLPQDLRYLWDTTFDSASTIAHAPRTSFISIMSGKGMPEDSAVAIHDHAGMIDLRNEQAWTALLSSKSQWSPATMSSNGTSSTAPAASSTATTAAARLINYTNLFGDVYINSCDDCSSVTSPAAYYVDLLRMLKNCPSNPASPSSPSLLSKLIERRPDLRDLELTCANTNVLIPYVDLVNEAMESFVANMPTSGSATTVPMQAFNMTENDGSSRNIQQPQKTQLSVYKDRLGKQVYPLNIFPYNQAIDTIRSYATAFGASRYEMMVVAQSKYILSKSMATTGTEGPDAASLVLRYALAAESLNLQPADYVAITGTSIFPRSYYSSPSGSVLSETDYASMIGLGTVNSYWGYTSSGAMMADIGGLSNVADQFLVRTAMPLQDLLDLLQTRFAGGRLVLGNTADAPIFNADVKDLRLRHPISSDPRRGLTAADCFALQAFIRLWRKSGWKLYDLDLGLNYFSDKTGSADALPLINAESIAALSQVQELQRLTLIPIEKLMPLWGLIDTFGQVSLYAKLFLQGDRAKVDPIFGQDPSGLFLTDTEVKISDNRSALAACLNIQDEHFGAVLWAAGVSNNVLDLANISAIYRARLFCEILEISPLQYFGFLKLFKPGFSPFKTPQGTVETLKQWRSYGQEGLTLPQILFITGTDQLIQMTNPGYGISDRNAVEVVCAVLTGLQRLEKEVPLGSAIDSSRASAAEVTRIASLVFDPDTAPQVADFVEGTGATSRTSADPTYQNVLLPHFKNDEANANAVFFQQTQPTGTNDEVAIALEAQSTARRLLFLRAVSPVLKARLEADLIVNCVTNIVPGNDAVVTRLLVSDIICNVSTNRPALQVFRDLLKTNDEALCVYGSAQFQPPSTDTYRFHVPNAPNQSAPKVAIDGVALLWTTTGDGWSSNQVKLSKGESYTLKSSTDFSSIRFSNVRSARLAFNSDVLVSSKSLQEALDILIPLLRAAEFINAFELDVPTIQFMHRQAVNTTLSVDFSNIVYDDVGSAQRFNQLRRRTITTELHAIDYFKWTATKDLSISLVEKLSALTGASRLQLDEFLDAKYPGLAPTALLDLFCDDREIASLLDVVDFSSSFGIPGISLKLFFKWATPLDPTKVTQHYDHAAEIQRIAQLLPLSDSGDSPIARANDKVRANQRQALATYLLQQEFMRSRNILDFGNLFEYFLIDIEMSPCLQTSRLKQAISTVQLFTQRCILGLEKARGIASGTVNLDRWDWMQKYRIWEANRKVFLYPENWLEPSLRDSKSQAFQALEDAMLQTDLNEDSIKRLIRDYIYSAGVVADLSIQAYSWDRRSDSDGTLHFFARTRQAPYAYFYRSATVSGSPTSASSCDSFTQWTAWSQIDVDIPPIETHGDGKPLELPGTYLIPAVRDQRIFLFFPHMTLKTRTQTENVSSSQTFQSMSNSKVGDSQPQQVWQIQMAWTEYRNGKWTPKVVAPNVLSVSGARVGDLGLSALIAGTIWDGCSFKIAPELWQAVRKMPSVDSFKFSTFTRPGNGDVSVVTIVVDRWVVPAQGDVYRFPCGAFEFRGEQLILLDRDAFSATPYATAFTKTIPNVFNKLVWNGSNLSLTPTYQIALSGNDVATPYWASRNPPANTARPTSMYTMSFDLSRISTASGLIVELQWPNHFQTIFNQVKIAGKATGTYDIATSEEMSHALWPAVLNATTSNYQLDQAFATLSADMDQGSKYQLFGAENVNRNETSMPAAIYTWELGFHVVMLLVERLRDLQQFDLGMRVARYVFDPTIDGDKLNRCWKFFPFKEIAANPIPNIESMLGSLSASGGAESSMSPNILAWRRNPFKPHTVARGRPGAYMKRFVTTYIELLIGSGDNYFRQNTLETLPLAINRYIEASHLFGSAPAPLPKMGRRAPRSYAQLETSFNDFANSSFDLELNFPFWCDPSKRGGTVPQTSASGSYSLTGMLRSTYFCVPTNPKVIQLKNLIEDRLFKIRNCQDINGVARSLSLFEPPIDVGAAVRAMAAGISVNALLNDSVGPMPNVRFAALLQKALDTCSELKDMGAAFQAVKESRDAEALAALQAKQDQVMQEMTMTTKTLARDEMLRSIEELRETRKGHITRLQFWLALTGDQKDVPDETTDWDDIAQSIETPSADGLAMTSNELAEQSQTMVARDCYIAAISINSVAAGFKAVPNITLCAEPLGAGAQISDIYGNISDAMSTIADVIGTGADMNLLDAAQAARKAEFIGRLQDRRQEANAAGRDIKIVDRQLATLQISLQLCEEDIRQQSKMIENAAATSDFLRNKYTSQQLYVWMDGQIRNLFYQTYLLANDLAKKVQKLYRFERSNDKTEYVAQGYWNASRDGLLSGENLYLALKHLEVAYDAHKGHDFEITKKVSLRSVQPLALVNLRETGSAVFTLPEVLFDYDYPGHYMRRIKTLSVSVPTSEEISADMCATLRLLEHRYRTTATATSGQDYPMNPVNDDRFSTDQIPMTAIAVSQADDDSGAFDYELEFNDYQRYVPFEGAGVISKWQLELPATFRQFDYGLINDIVIKLKYTSMYGGVAFRKFATDAVSAFHGSVANLSASEGLFSMIDVPKDYPTQWTTLADQSPTVRSVKLVNLLSKLPFFARTRRVRVETVTAFISAKNTAVAWPSELTVSGQAPLTLKAGFDVGRFKTVTQTGLSERLTDWTVSLTATGGNSGLQDLKFVVRYTIQ